MAVNKRKAPTTPTVTRSTSTRFAVYNDDDAAEQTPKESDLETKKTVSSSTQNKNQKWQRFVRPILILMLIVWPVYFVFKVPICIILIIRARY